MDVRWESQSAHYVTVRDSVRLAVDVNLPPGREVGDAHPALLELTRYGRSGEEAGTGQPIPSLGPLDRFFLDHGYVVVKVDARGSGASFGTRPVEYGPEEVRDGYDVVEWVVQQSWSDGTVGAYGTSYSGTTAELLAAVDHPAVKAVVPGWSDFDMYESPARPYGPPHHFPDFNLEPARRPDGSERRRGPGSQHPPSRRRFGRLAAGAGR